MRAVRKLAAADFKAALELKPGFYQAHRELAGQSLTTATGVQVRPVFKLSSIVAYVLFGGVRSDLYSGSSGGGLKQQPKRGLRHMRTALKQLAASGDQVRPEYFYALGEIHAGG